MASTLRLGSLLDPMSRLFPSVDGCALVGMVHLGPLPGSLPARGAGSSVPLPLPHGHIDLDRLEVVRRAEEAATEADRLLVDGQTVERGIVERKSRCWVCMTGG